MPERYKLTAKQVESILNSGLHGKWVVVNITDGAILGSGTGVIKALRDAKAKHPAMDLDDVAIMMVAHQSRPRRRAAASGV